MKIYFCKPYIKHLLEKFPFDWKHQIHKWTCGIVLIEHIEPDGLLASKHHKDLLKYKFKIVLKKL